MGSESYLCVASKQEAVIEETDIKKSLARASVLSNVTEAALHRTLFNLSQPVIECLSRNDKKHPVFNGCVDWHSSVHAVWALIRYRMVTKDKQYDQLIIKKLDKSLIVEEYRQLKEKPYFEMPYGRAWFLRLVIDYEIEFRTDLLKEIGDYVAISLFGYYSNIQANPYNPSYENPSWALINLYQYGLHRNNTKIKSFVRKYVIEHFVSHKDRCATIKNDDSLGFMDVCGNWAYLVAETNAVYRYSDWLENFYSDTSIPSPVVIPKNTHEKGLNFSRAWSYWYIYNTTRNALFLDAYHNHLQAMLSNRTWWSGNDYSVTHWIAQFGIYALTTSYNKHCPH